jgi:integrase
VPLNRNGGPWEGGYISLGAGGRRTFIIERSVNGMRFHVSTRCHIESAAYQHLKRFETDPTAYDPRGAQSGDTLALTEALVLEFVRWQLREKGNTRKHVAEMAHRLADWVEDLGGRDLRRVTLGEHIIPALDRRQRCRQHRVIALKSLYGWLRTEKYRLKAADDPTYGTLKVPQAVPAKHTKKKAVDFDRVRAMAARLEPADLDCVIVLAATGWHVTELERFTREAESEIIYERIGNTIAGLRMRHKTKKIRTTPITSPEALRAAERIRKRKTVPRRLNDKVRAACRAAGVEEFTLGRMRHSVGTWAHQRGATRGQVADMLHHEDPKTTDRFYVDVGVSPAPIKLPRLRLVKAR